jgi:hypothetical protein
LNRGGRLVHFWWRSMMVDSYWYIFSFEQRRWAFGTFLVEEHDGWQLLVHFFFWTEEVGGWYFFWGMKVALVRFFVKGGALVCFLGRRENFNTFLISSMSNLLQEKISRECSRILPRNFFEHRQP